jgi:Ca2+-binding RTX toxin-like protein
VTVTDVNELGKTITGTTANDVITPSASVTAFRTTARDDTIFALAGNDTIDGGAGADRMEGGAGNDVYYVDSWSEDGKSSNDDLVVESANSGVDLVNSIVSYRLAAEVENLTLLGTVGLSGTGNDLANVITGNSGANVLSGEGGNDTIAGGLGNDTLFGGAGLDKLDGGAGADVMDGGADDDTYTVDTFSDDGIATNDDQVVELAGGGTADLVKASVSYVLPDQVERLTLTGTDPINGTGNALDNTLSGNAGANTLSGGAGSDTLFGNAGDDLLLGGDGIDRLEGGAGADRLEGGASNDTMTGQAGNDLLIGGTGKDTLTGGLDADTFQFALPIPG